MPIDGRHEPMSPPLHQRRWILVGEQLARELAGAPKVAGRLVACRFPGSLEIVPADVGPQETGVRKLLQPFPPDRSCPGMFLDAPGLRKDLVAAQVVVVVSEFRRSL